MPNNASGTRVGDIIDDKTHFIAPDATLKEAALKMKESRCGFLPVGTRDKVEGAITDRDIVVRAIADGGDPTKVKVKDAMTALPISCNVDDTLVMAARKMRDGHVSRLVVKDEDGKVKGVLSFGRILRGKAGDAELAAVVGCATGRSSDIIGMMGVQ